MSRRDAFLLLPGALGLLALAYLSVFWVFTVGPQ